MTRWMGMYHVWDVTSAVLVLSQPSATVTLTAAMVSAWTLSQVCTIKKTMTIYSFIPANHKWLLFLSLASILIYPVTTNSGMLTAIVCALSSVTSDLWGKHLMFDKLRHMFVGQILYLPLDGNMEDHSGNNRFGVTASGYQTPEFSCLDRATNCSALFTGSQCIEVRQMAQTAWGSIGRSRFRISFTVLLPFLFHLCSLYMKKGLYADVHCFDNKFFL